MTTTTRRQITDVQIIGDCEIKHCKRPMVLVTFEGREPIAVHDDGSFIEWLGESNT